jgi:hypothetical protein
MWRRRGRIDLQGRRDLVDEHSLAGDLRTKPDRAWALRSGEARSSNGAIVSHAVRSWQTHGIRGNPRSIAGLQRHTEGMAGERIDCLAAIGDVHRRSR